MPNPTPTEAQEQKALIDWTKAMRSRYPELALLVHIPNEGQRSAITGAHLRQQGMKKGFPDLFLPVARHGKHGLFIEMKRRGGRVSPDQAWWLERLNDQGYAATVCYGWDEARKVIEHYLDKPDSP